MMTVIEAPYYGFPDDTQDVIDRSLYPSSRRLVLEFRLKQTSERGRTTSYLCPLQSFLCPPGATEIDVIVNLKPLADKSGCRVTRIELTGDIAAPVRR